MRHLGETHFVVAPDYPGMGESALPPESPAVTVEDYAACMVEAADHFDIDNFFVAGYHTGALVVVEVAHLVPTRVRHVVMIGAPVLSAAEVEQFLVTYAPIPLDIQGTRFQRLWDNVVRHRGAGMTLEMMACSFAESLRGGEAYEWGHEAAFNYALRFPERVQSLPVAATVLNPGDDLQVETRRIEPYLNGQRLIEYPEWNHGYFDVHPAQAARRLIAACAGEHSD